jgi:hypothetical protein
MAYSEFSAGAWSTSDLLSDVRRKARLSDSDADYTDVVLLRIATDVLITRAAQVHVLAREGHALAEAERTVSSEAVSEDGAEYVLPPWAMGEAISRVFYSSGDGSDEAPLDYVGGDVEPDMLADMASGEPWGYTLIGNRLRLIPRPESATGTIRFLYPRRHGQLVASTEIRQLLGASDSGSGTTLQLASSPPASWAVGAWVDVYGSTIPHSLSCTDARISLVGASSVVVEVPYATLGARLNSDPTKNYVALSGESGHVHVPLELRPGVTSLVAASVLRDLGFLPDANDREAEGMRVLGVAQDLITPRHKGTKEKIINRNSLFRGASRKQRGGGGWL